MKTTVEISDLLYMRAKAVMARDNRTLRDLVEDGLRRALDEGDRLGEFKLRQASFRGQGLQPGIRAGDWNQLRELLYEGRGG